MSADTSTTPAVEEEFDFSGASGADAAREAFKNAQTSFNKIEFLGIDGSPAAVQAGTNFVMVRLLSDFVALPGQNLAPWITVDQHSMVKTKPKPANFDGTWPQSMGAVCRNDKVFKARYGDCCIEAMPVREGRRTNRPSPRTWAIAVLREEVVGDGSEALGGPEWAGKVVGVRDKTKEIAKVGADGKPTGETELVKQYVKINQGWKNFFGLLSGHAGHYKTVLDRDYWISREGMDQNNTVYTITPADPIDFPANHPQFPGKRFDLRDEAQRAAFYPDLPDLRKIVAEQASNEYYNRFFAPEDALYGDGSKGEGFDGKQGGTAAPASSSAPATPASTPAAPGGDAAAPNTEALAALKAKITGGPGAPAPQAAPAAQTPAETAPPAESAATEAPAAEQTQTAPPAAAASAGSPGLAL